MKALLLTARPALTANRRLVEAGTNQGLDVRVVDATRVTASLGAENGLWLGFENLLEPAPDLSLARVGNWRPESVLAMLEVATRAGVATPNAPSAIRRGRDHWRTVEVLQGAGLPVPETMAGADPEAVAAASVRLELPVVVKLRRSRMGIGVILCRTLDHLESVLDSLWRVGDEFIVQRWLDTGGVSLRLFVVGDEVVAAARFEARSGEWRSNGARGGVAAALDATNDQIALAVAAAKAMGLGLCGVDLLPAASGDHICEVNPTPGFLRLEEATGVDVAAAVIRYAAGL